MATALPLATDTTGASVTEAQGKTAFTSQRASLAEMGDPMGIAGSVQNLSLAFSVAGNALTCNVKTRAGAAPSSTDPVTAAMRNATLATGDFNVRNITAALSLVISSGSTLGHLSATASFIYWYLIDNVGTLELAASTTYFGSKGIVTTTAEGGAGAADSSTVMYSATARSSVPFICVGRTIDTQTTAGTWTAVPSTVELAPIDAIVPSLGNEQASTSGTSIDFNGIPSWVKRITVQFNAVSTSGSDNLLVQVGDAGGIETSGYTSSSALLENAASPGVDNSTTGFVIKSPGSTAAFRGHLLLTLEDASDNTWIASGVLSASGIDLVVSGGAKALSATLDRVRITTTLGSNTFDGGAVNIQYE